MASIFRVHLCCRRCSEVSAILWSCSKQWMSSPPSWSLCLRSPRSIARRWRRSGVWSSFCMTGTPHRCVRARSPSCEGWGSVRRISSAIAGSFPVAGRCALPWPSCCCRSRRCCCWTSRPITWTFPVSVGWSRACGRIAVLSASSAMMWHCWIVWLRVPSPSTTGGRRSTRAISPTISRRVSNARRFYSVGRRLSSGSWPRRRLSSTASATRQRRPRRCRAASSRWRRWSSLRWRRMMR